MENIAKPTKISYGEGDMPNKSIVTIEPFYPGYGMTLGNSLRRILLSSLPGAAVTGIRIKGASHEFSTIPHVKEDVLQIILNLKKLRLKLDGEEDVKLELDVIGKKEIKAKDIKKNSKVEIINSDLVLANITDMAGSINMELTVGPGRGYKSVEQKKNEKEDINFIEMDAIFSPVLSVGINVENVRVGNMTNWDKLILNIKTDGTIEPKEAFNEAVKVLVDQFNSLLDLEKGPEKEVEEEKKEEDKEEKKGDKKAAKEEKKEKEDKGKKVKKEKK